MALSFGPFFTCFIVTLFLTVYLHIIMHHTSVFHKRTIQFSLIGILVILIRMSIPFSIFLLPIRFSLIRSCQGY